jgi:hypothetical protein
MTRLARLLPLLAAAMLATGAACAAHTAPPSVVLAHGAFADGSDWARVIAPLQARGVSALARRIGAHVRRLASSRVPQESQPAKATILDTVQHAR